MPNDLRSDSSSDELEARCHLWAEQHGRPEWAPWLAAILPGHCTAPFAAHQIEFWNWLWSIEPGVRPQAFVGIWARGGAKSTSAEGACVALGARRKRRYGLYVCDTQDRADDHVGNVGGMLESERVEMFYPRLAERRVGKHGNSRGWRRNRLWTADGFVIDAIGLDTAARGVKLEDQRPDFIVIDDIDGRRDTLKASQVKAETLTDDVIPAGAEDVAVLAIQNVVIPNGVFAQLADGRAGFLQNRVLSGPVPALVGMKVERRDGVDVIVDGEPTWAGQTVERCQSMIEDMGLRAFMRECQHAVTDVEGALWIQAQIDASRVDETPMLTRVVVAVDPSGGEGAGHDAQGIVACGRGADDHGYVLADETCSLSPAGWGRKAVTTAIEVNADRIVSEDDYGGNMSLHTIRVAAEQLVREGVEEAGRFTGTGVDHVNTGGRSKRVRAEPIAALYGDPQRSETWPDSRVHHVGDLVELEGEQTSWDPDGGGKSPNRVDAVVWALTELRLARHSGGGLTVRADRDEYLNLEPFGRFAPDDTTDEPEQPVTSRRGGARCRT